jgi:hypothetical protein
MKLRKNTRTKGDGNLGSNLNHAKKKKDESCLIQKSDLKKK